MALPNTNIDVGEPPLLWSTMQDAFNKINDNFLALDLATGGSGGAVDLSTLNTNVSPETTAQYSLGSFTNKWKNVYTAEWNEALGSELNGLWAGSAQIKGKGFIIDLPAGSTVDDNLIIDPDKTFFKEVSVDNDTSVVAATFADTLNLNAGTAMQLVVSSASDSITFNNTGVTQLNGTPGQIGVSGTTGDITLTNLGVLSLTSTTALPSGRTTGTGINIDAATGSGIKVTNTGVIAIEAGSAALTISTDAATGIVTITNAAPAGNAFRYVYVDGDLASPLEANSVNGALNLLSGAGITLTKVVGSDTVTVSVNPRFDLKGSIFGDDSSKLVDAVEGKFYGQLFGNVTGNVTGNADSATLANTATSVTLVATETTAATHYVTFVDTAIGNENVRTDTNLTYNPGTNTLTAGSFAGNLTGTVTGNIFTTLIDSADSSAITVTPKTIFSSDVDIENELRVRGSLVISITQLKSVVAASTDFADFKTKIAAL